MFLFTAIVPVHKRNNHSYFLDLCLSFHEVLVKVKVKVEVEVKDKVEDQVEVALLYFVCIDLLQKDSCERLLYFTLQNVIKYRVVVVVWCFQIIIPTKFKLY